LTLPESVIVMPPHLTQIILLFIPHYVVFFLQYLTAALEFFRSDFQDFDFFLVLWQLKSHSL
jgi:hypothetical protein